MGSAPDLLLDDPRSLIQRDGEVVFYCAEPSGGLEGWRQAGLVVEPLRVESPVHAMAR
jgi:hypothetical protein